MKLVYKIFWLIVIVIITYPLGWTCYVNYGKFNFYPWYDQTRHIVGYSILGFLFGWITLVCAILDEVIQLFVKHKVFHFGQIVSNFLSALVGIGLRQFIKFRNPFNEKDK